MAQRDGGARPVAGDRLYAIQVPFADPDNRALTLLQGSSYSARAEIRRKLSHYSVLDDP